MSRNESGTQTIDTTEICEPPPVFIVGCGRSGTTLLRLMLNAHPELAIPRESHFIYGLARQHARRGWPTDLSDEKHWHWLLRFMQNHPSLQQKWEFDAAPVADRLVALEHRSVSAVFRAVYIEYMLQKGKSRWGDKTPMHVQYMLLIHQLFPNARFIHVIRDGRAVAQSLMSRKWGPRHMAIAGHYWKWLVLSGAVGGGILGPKHYRQISLEDLTLDPEHHLRALCEWLGLTFSNSMLAYHSTEDALKYGKRSGVADKLRQPLDPKHVHAWTNRMTPRDQQRIVRQAGAMLAYLGYPVPRLSPRQERDLRAIQTLLIPENLAELANLAPIRSGGELRLRVGLAYDNFLQLGCFLDGRFAEWARLGIRWQRTVAEMMR